MNEGFKYFSLQGHPTAQQYMSANGSQTNPMRTIIATEEEELIIPDIDIQDVSPKKKQVPIFTKKGKLLIGLIIVGSALYYIWKKHRASKGLGTESKPEAKSEGGSVENEEKSAVEQTNQTVQRLTNENGIEV